MCDIEWTSYIKLMNFNVISFIESDAGDWRCSSTTRSFKRSKLLFTKALIFSKTMIAIET